VGRLVYQKNFAALIHAVSRLKTSLPVKLTIVGNGPLAGSLKRLAQKLSVNLTLIDSLTYEKIAGFLQSADIFVMTSHHEGSPKALLEAMSCGLACLVSDKPYSRFIITNNQDGILTENSVENLLLSMNRLIDSLELRRRLGVAARQTIRERFDNRKIISQEINLLLSLIK